MWCIIVITGEGERWAPLASTLKFNLPMSAHLLLNNHIYFHKNFWSEQIHSLQLSPYWKCLNQISSSCKQPHPLLTRHDLTHAMFTISEKSPDCFATVLLHQYKQFNWGCPWACYQSWDVLADAGFLLQYSMHMEMIKGHSEQSGEYDHFDLAWSMEGTTKQVANI